MPYWALSVAVFSVVHILIDARVSDGQGSVPWLPYAYCCFALAMALVLLALFLVRGGKRALLFLVAQLAGFLVAYLPFFRLLNWTSDPLPGGNNAYFSAVLRQHAASILSIVALLVFIMLCIIWQAKAHKWAAENFLKRMLRIGFYGWCLLTLLLSLLPVPPNFYLFGVYLSDTTVGISWVFSLFTMPAVALVYGLVVVICYQGGNALIQRW